MPSTATKDEIRRLNLSALLTEVFYSGPISRSSLGGKLGLSKTTVSELVAQLEEFGLLSREGVEARGGAGRPSQIVSPNDAPTVLVVNPEVDGVNLSLISFSSKEQLNQFVPFRTRYSFDTTKALISKFLESLTKAQRDQVHGITLALPGGIDQETKTLLDAPSLGWGDLPVDSELAEISEHRVWLINNARAATLGEHSFGAGKGIQNLIYLFSGVGGIGGGFVVGNNILEGANSLAGEIGKMRLFRQGPEFERTLGEALKREELAEHLGGEGISDAELLAAISTKLSIEVNQILDAQVEALVSALETLRDLFDPNKIILGGYLGSVLLARSKQIEFLLDQEPLRRKSKELLIARPTQVKEMVQIGGAVFAWQSIIRNPVPVLGGGRNAS